MESAQSKLDNKFMSAAFDAAFDHIGRTSPNPAVGAVIVKNNTVISSGGTCPYGGNHAEVVAIEKAGVELTGASMYVSLEPCNHFGKTPPCTEAIIRSGISRVCVPLLDPNPLVAGRGISRLKEAGIDVVMMHHLGGDASDLLRQFKKFILRKKPFIIHKSAMTLDGRIATSTGDSRWVSSAYARYLVHKLRAKVDAIIIGKNTFMNDDPSLNVRFDDFVDVVPYFNETSFEISGHNNLFLKFLLRRAIPEYSNPLRVLIGLPENISPEKNFFRDDNYIIFASSVKVSDYMKSNPGNAGFIGSLNLVALTADNHADEVDEVLEHLGKRGVMLAMVEGGGRTAGSFFDAGEMDQFMYVITPKIIGNGISTMCGEGIERMAQAFPVRDVSSVMIRDEVLYNGYSEQYNFEMM